MSNGETVLGVALATRPATNPNRVRLELTSGQTLSCAGGPVTVTQDVEDLAANRRA